MSRELIENHEKQVDWEKITEYQCIAGHGTV